MVNIHVPFFSYFISRGRDVNAPVYGFNVFVYGIDDVIYDFMKTISGIRNSAILRCSDCGNWNIQLTKRKKLYCSNRCAARAGSRKKRGELKKDVSAYEEYRKNGIKRALKSYDSKLPEGRYRIPRKKLLDD